RPQSQGTEADSDRRLLPCLDAGRFAPVLTGPGLAPAVDLDVEAAADLDFPVQQLFGAAVEGVLPASHEVRGFEVPVAIGTLEPPRREGIGERRGAVVRWIGHISNLTRRIPERRLTVRMAKVASSDRARMMPETASVNRLSAQQLGEAAAARRGRNDPTRPRSPDWVETTRRDRGRPAPARCGTVGTERRQDQRRTGMRTLNGIDEIESLIGTELGSSEWVTMDQDAINTFADVTDDHQWIHVDEARAAEDRKSVV